MNYIREALFNLDRVDNLQPVEDVVMADAQQFSAKRETEIDQNLDEVDKLPELKKPFLGAEKQPVPKEIEWPKIELEESLFESVTLKEESNGKLAEVKDELNTVGELAANVNDELAANPIKGVSYDGALQDFKQAMRSGWGKKFDWDDLDLSESFNITEDLDEDEEDEDDITLKIIKGNARRDKNETGALKDEYAGPIEYKEFSILSTDEGDTYKIMRGDDIIKSGFDTLADAKAYILISEEEGIKLGLDETEEESE